MLLMALSNTYGWLVVSTGNKSELAVGYATLYGDMVGGFALLKDVFKTDVFRLARHLNERAGRELIPRDDDRARRRAPSSAPTSATTSRCRPTTCSTRCSRPTSSSTARARSCSPSSTPTSVERALALVDRAEYKRRQAPPGVKLRPRAFGRDWRPPITNRWQGSRTAPLGCVELRSCTRVVPTSARNQRSRSSHGTAAFAGEVEGSTKSASRRAALLETVLGPLAERPSIGLLADERDDAGPQLAGDRLEPLRAPAKSAARRSPEPGVVRWAAFVTPIPSASSSNCSVGSKQPRREAGRVEQAPEVVARVREVRARASELARPG